MSDKPTGGEWVAYYDDYHGTWNVEVAGSDAVARLWQMCEETHNRDPLHEDEAEANARLIAEAGTVYNATGLGPRELSQKVDDLYREMRAYLPIIEWLEARPELWIQATQQTGIATANGYRHAIETAGKASE